MSPERLLSSNLVGRLLADLELLVEIESSATISDGIHEYVFGALFTKNIFDVFIVPHSITTSVVVNEDGALETIPVSNYLTSNESVDDEVDEQEEDQKQSEATTDESTAPACSSSSANAAAGPQAVPPTMHPQQYTPHLMPTGEKPRNHKRPKLNHAVETQMLDAITFSSSPVVTSTNPRMKRILIERNAFIQAMKSSYKDIIGVYFSRKNGYRRILDEYPFKKAVNAKRNVPYFELRCVLVFLIDMLHLSQTEADWEVILKHAYVMEAMSLASAPSATSGVV
jgi:hypothetical protein